MLLLCTPCALRCKGWHLSCNARPLPCGSFGIVVPRTRCLYVHASHLSCSSTKHSILHLLLLASFVHCVLTRPSTISYSTCHSRHAISWTLTYKTPTPSLFIPIALMSLWYRWSAGRLQHLPVLTVSFTHCATCKLLQVSLENIVCSGTWGWCLLYKPTALSTGKEGRVPLRDAVIEMTFLGNGRVVCIWSWRQVTCALLFCNASWGCREEGGGAVGSSRQRGMRQFSLDMSRWVVGKSISFGNPCHRCALTTQDTRIPALSCVLSLPQRSKA
mmetsp:Transcript_65848/g.122869  ORF Transcript_65848/g.122869 Transcript_65848/m.122869 type:complete len:273 (+) Transcript_65848:1047-1865(+)